MQRNSGRTRGGFEAGNQSDLWWMEWIGLTACVVLVSAVVGTGCAARKTGPRTYRIPSAEERVSGPSYWRDRSVASRRMRAGAADPGATSPAPAPRARPKPKKSEPRPQAWKRSARGTILSKVSVGGGKFLQLKKMRVTVRVEGPRVRTIIDHIYYNPHGRALQGTFRYTLPPDASISYYAMFVGRSRRAAPRFFSDRAPSGKAVRPRDVIRVKPQEIATWAPRTEWSTLREARLVPARKGREVYEEITRRRIDPALLEQVAPNTFQGRVFPIPARGYNRVIIAYEETLPQLAGRQLYRFRFPRDVGERIDFSLLFDGRRSTLTRHNLAQLGCRPGRGPFLRCVWGTRRPDRDAVLYFRPARRDVAWTTGVDPVQKRRYLFAQLRVPEPGGLRAVRVPRAKGREHAVFLLDTSLSENPDHFAASVRLLKRILARNPSLKRWNVLLFDVGASWLQPRGWIRNDDAGRALLSKLDTLLLEGATHLDGALRRLAAPRWLRGRGPRVDVFVLSDGQVSWGEPELERMLHRFDRSSRWAAARFFTYQFGLGAENLPLLRRLARGGGSLFTCLGRTELDRCAVAHTRPAVSVERVTIEGIGATETLLVGRGTALRPGSLLALATRYAREGRATVLVHGEYRGRPVTLRWRLPVRTRGELAARAWGELAVRHLAALHDPHLTRLLVAYAQHFRIPNPHCSFLVLETDREYKQYGLETLQRQQRVTDLGRFLQARRAARGAPVPMRQRWLRLLTAGIKRAGGLRSSTGVAVRRILAAVPAAHLRLDGAVPGGMWRRADVPGIYLRQRLHPRHGFAPFVTEATRRLRRGQVAGAVRSLSSIVERHPGDPRGLRLVGYYLQSWKQPALAAWAFLRAVEQRPYEPQAWRDLARALLRLRRPGLAAALYEVVVAGRWHSRFGRVRHIAREEYALLVSGALRQKLDPRVAAVLRERAALLGLTVTPSRLRVTVTWNTDHTDIDLWVREPDGDKCWYKHKRTRSGGVLLEDIQRGYGPERYETRRGTDGVYTVRLKFYGHASNTFGNETHAYVLMVVDAGTPRQRVIERSVVLKRKDAVVRVADVRLGRTLQVAQ